jgi:hypothetical protein
MMSLREGKWLLGGGGEKPGEPGCKDGQGFFFVMTVWWLSAHTAVRVTMNFDVCPFAHCPPPPQTLLPWILGESMHESFSKLPRGF